jgi:hypothetical protein
LRFRVFFFATFLQLLAAWVLLTCLARWAAIEKVRSHFGHLSLPLAMSNLLWTAVFPGHCVTLLTVRLL